MIILTAWQTCFDRSIATLTPAADSKWDAPCPREFLDPPFWVSAHWSSIWVIQGSQSFNRCVSTVRYESYDVIDGID